MVEYWHWHSIHNAVESHWKGVLSHDLIPGDVYREAASIGRDFQRLGGSLANLKRKSDVALILSNRSLTGLKHSAAFAGASYGDILRWIYDGFFRLNLSCDILHDTARDFSGYGLVVTPGLYCPEQGLIQALKEYVAQGGHLLSTFRSFFCDAYGKIRAVPQPGEMAEVFGMTYDTFTVPEDVPGVEAWMELLRPEEGTRVLCRYSHPVYRPYAAVTWHPWGRGSAAYIGAMLEPGLLDQMLEELLPSLGLQAPALRWPVVMKQGTNDLGQTIAYLLHYSAEARRIAAPVSGRSLLDGRQVHQGDSLNLMPWDVVILAEENPRALI